MDLATIKPGIRVKVVRLGTADGMIIGPKYLVARKLGAIGIVNGWVPGHGGDVWWVTHQDDGGVAAYSFTELELAEDK